MKPHQQHQLNLVNSTPNLLIVFSVLISFTIGFVSSPLIRTPMNHCAPPPAASNSPSESSTVDTPVRVGFMQESLTENTEGVIKHEDGFLTKVRQLPDDLLRFHYSCRASQPDPSTARTELLSELFDGNSPFTAFPPRHISRLVRKQRIKGWGSDHPVFERLIREVRPRIVVELGTFLGASAIHMAKTIQRLYGDDFTIFCLDDFRGWPGFRKTFTDIGQEHGNVMLMNQFLQNVVFSNVTDKIVPVPFSTNTGLYKLCELGVRADLIEVDAGHDFHSAWTDINLAWSLMRSDGKSVMFGHDYFNGADYHGVRRAVDLFAKLNGLTVEADGQHWIYRADKEKKHN